MVHPNNLTWSTLHGVIWTIVKRHNANLNLCKRYTVHVKSEFKKVTMSFMLFIDIPARTAGSLCSRYICKIMYNTSLLNVYITVGLIQRTLNDIFYMFWYALFAKIYNNNIAKQSMKVYIALNLLPLSVINDTVFLKNTQNAVLKLTFSDLVWPVVRGL